MPLQLTATLGDPALLDLPWSTPLEKWPAEQLVTLPRGLSRHIVRSYVDTVLVAKPDEQSVLVTTDRLAPPEQEERS